MARIEKRARTGGRTVYIAKWYTITGQDRSKTFASKKDAEAHLTKVRNAKLHGNEFDPASGRMLFREAAALWLDDRKASLKATTYAAHAERLAPTTAESMTRHARLTHKGQPLRIDPSFGDYPLNKITHDDVQAWVNRLVASGRQPSSVRNLFFVVRQILEWAVKTKKLTANPAEHVQLPGNRTASVAKGANKSAAKRSRRRDDPARFLTAAQVAVLAAATPWPYSVFVHTDAWTGLRPGEIIGLRVGDVHWAGEDAGESWLSVAESVAVIDGEPVYLDPKTEGSVRDVPLTADTAARLRAYLAVHPNLHDPDAPLFPGFSAVPLRLPHMRKREPGTVPPSRLSAAVRDAGAELRAARHEDLPPADRQAAALADLSVDEAAARLTFNWDGPLRLDAFRKTIWNPAVLRANRIGRETAEPGMVPITVPPGVTPYALRHTYASLSAAAGIKPLALSRRMGHVAVTMTMNVYAHLYRESAADDMAALGAMAVVATPPTSGVAKVIPLRG
ncbi:tyrosine-type recombinase/integrase [Mycolicibacterium diernhoferi]|uniref:Site-specific integrase n=2 Tax=Mycolicibacterium diernhoferi TaxID=1801 RepID=A0A2A7P0C1_9MYCO|nr:site-specific integrase [Mycolicibacterium diernhoferi]PEG56182.1 site-specific integrase [Mycolicibacterium diernhoferi]